MIYLQLFLSYLKIGFFGFGGGYAMLSLIHSEVVVRNGWITNSEFTDIVAISQMTPGPIGVNGATFFGYRLAGVPGAVAASALLLLPGSLLMYAALRSLEKFSEVRFVKGVLCGARPASVALMLSALLVFASQSVALGGISSAVIAAAAFLAVWRKWLSPVPVIALSAFAACAAHAFVGIFA